MAIVREKKPITVIDNHIINNPELSLTALGAMVLILSLRDSSPSIPNLVALRKEPESVIRAAVNELVKSNYIKL